MSEQNKSDQKMHDALKRTVRHVVETMCFSEVALTDESWEKADTIITAVNFYGSRSGRLQLEVSSSAAWSLRDAFLGTSEQDRGAEETAGQVVGELGTMICGRFLSSVDPLSKMSLATPEVGQQSVTGDKASQHVRQGFVLESGHLTASVEFDNEKA
jgi:CheY-specific phosphatase CheX